MISSKLLSDGTTQHTFTDDAKWIGIQQPNTTMAKTKWTNLEMPVSRTWEFEASDRSKKAGFTKWIVTSVNDKLVCDCAGYRFGGRQCKHTKLAHTEL
jgi:hypothetical protein